MSVEVDEDDTDPSSHHAKNIISYLPVAVKNPENDPVGVEQT
jgi:hypothetical protein